MVIQIPLEDQTGSHLVDDGFPEMCIRDRSMTMMLSSYSMAVMFIPICSRPPRGMIFTLQFLLSLFAFFKF